MPLSREIQFSVHELRTLTGKRYPHLETAFERLDPTEQRELVQLVHDLKYEVLLSARRAAQQPWRGR